MKNLITLLALLLSCAASAAILRVDIDSPSLNPNGSSWASAFLSVEDAQDVAQAGDQIWVAEGNYEIDYSIYVGNNLEVYCGFAGWEWNLSQRDWESHPTVFTPVISGNFMDHPIALISNLEGGVVSEGVLDGATFSNWGFGASLSYAIFAGYEPKDILIRNCSFENMLMEQEFMSLFYSYLIGYTSQITFENCSFSNLTTSSEFCSYAAYGYMTFLECEFDACSFESGYTESAFRSAGFFNCSIRNSSMPSLSGINSSLNSCLVENCSFSHQDAAAFSSTNLVSCTVVENTVNSSLVEGGGMTNCIFWYNNVNGGSDMIDESVVASNCIVQESLPGAGANVFVENPLFENPSNNNWNLTQCSPAVDASTSTISIFTEDLNGNPRLVGNSLDFGCFEFQGIGRRTIYVDKNASGNEDGSSWEDAFTTIHAAVDVVCENSEIWVTNDIYYPNEDPGSPNRFATLFIPPGTELYGGFEGGEVSKEQRPLTTDPDALKTRLIGTNGTSDPTDDAYQNMVILSGSPSVTIDGFYFSLGRADGPGSFSSGGAIRMQDVTAYLNNCRFEANSGTDGGAIAITGASYVSLHDCVFGFNSATNDGGAIRCIDSGGDSPVFYAQRCWFVGNSASNGGAIYSTADPCSLSNSLFNSNSGQGGAIYAYNGFGAYNCTVVDHEEAVFVDGQHTVINSIFWDNDDDFVYGPFSLPSDPAVMFSNLGDPINAIGNISEDPQFVNPGAWDYTLQATSPCIDSGWLQGVVGSLDLLRNPRVFGSDVDMGCYEYNIPCSATNDICAEAETVPNDNETWFVAQMECASPEIQGYTWCGEEGEQTLWYHFEMPFWPMKVTCGNDPNNPPSGWTLTAYTGSCQATTWLQCGESVTVFDYVEPGEDVWIKVKRASNASLAEIVHFEPLIPSLVSAVPGQQSDCNFVQGLAVYDQEVVVEYTNGDYIEYISVNGTQYEATGSPQTILMSDLPADGASIDLVVSIGALDFLNINDFVQAPCCAPSNDNCSNPYILDLGEEAIGRTGCASMAPEDVLSSCTLDPGNSVWYQTHAPPSGSISITGTILDSNGNFNLRISVWDFSNGCAAPVEVGCINDFGDGIDEFAVISGLNPGQDYLFMVSGWQFQDGVFQIEIEAEGSVCGCVGDFDNDCVIAGSDLLVFLANFGCAGNCVADFDGDLTVNSNDLLTFLAVYNSTCN